MTDDRCIFIRTDGNPDIANGHLMRCLSVARALADDDIRVVFGVSDRVSEELLSSFLDPGETFEIAVLQTDYRIQADETALLEPVLKAHNAGCILVDSYFVTRKYLLALRGLARTAYIDDLTAFDYPVDLVVNYDAAPDPAFYRSAERKLLGSSYTPLRSQFQGLVPYVRPEAHHLLVSTGGTDPFNLALNLASALEASGIPLSVHILTGPMHAHYRELIQFAETHPFISLHENVRNMAALMCSCDLAVTAAGTTLFELCAAGVPAVSYTFADNQLQTAADMERYAGIPCAGDLREHLPEDTFAALLSAVRDLASSYAARQHLSETMHALVDGYGSHRIAEALTDQLAIPIKKGNRS